MRRSWKLVSLFGIPVSVHATWFILPLVYLAAVFVIGWMESVFLMALVVSVFACIVLHELGHALAARYFGIATRDITLYPIGGVARLEGMPNRPHQELLIAIAGPAVNVLIAALLVPIVLAAYFTDRLPPVDVTQAVSEGAGPTLLLYAFYLGSINVGLVLFNMLPTFPMDGGRVLRALLSMRLSLLRATEWAVGVGRALVVAAVICALIWQPDVFLHNPLLLVVGVFVFLAGQQELMAIRRHHAMNHPAPLLLQPKLASEGASQSGGTAVHWDPWTQTWMLGELLISVDRPERGPRET